MAVQLGVSLQEAHDVTAGKESFEVAVGYYWQLVNVIPTHHLERLECGGVWRNGAEFTQRPHHGLKAGLRPAIRR